jgi:hypothetical protein
MSNILRFKDKIKTIIYSLEFSLRILLFSNFKFKKQIYVIKKQNLKIRILGNGNSLAKGDFIDKKCDYMVVNRYYLSESYYEIKPLYYVIADPYFFTIEKGIAQIEEIISVTKWKMFLFLPYYKGKNLFFKKKETESVKIIFYNTSVFKGFNDLKTFFFNKMLAMPQVQNVLVASIMLSIWLKYNIIELYGVEHSWLTSLSVDEQNRILLENKHFYDKKEIKKEEFKKWNGDSYKLHELLYDFGRMFEAYWEIVDYLKNKNINIINKSSNSFIDAFKKEQ